MRSGWLPTAAVGASVVLWSTAYGLSSLVLVTASPAVLSELRLILSVPLMLVLLRVMPSTRHDPRALMRVLRRPRTVLLGLTGVALFYLPSNIGLSMAGAGTAALMSASLPVLTALLALWLLRERVGARIGTGLALATVGIAVASLDSFEAGPGALLLVAGLVSYALYTVLLRGYASPGRAAPASAGVRDDPDPLVLATATAIWGIVLLAPWLGWEAVSGTMAWPSDAAGWGSILILALVVTAPTMALFNYGAERVPAAVSGVASAVVPVFGYGFALLLGEPLDAVRIGGGLLALVGIVVAAVPVRSAAAAQLLQLDYEGEPDARNFAARE